MEIRNARIMNVFVGIDDLDRLSARMDFAGDGTRCSWFFVLANSVDVSRLRRLMEYTETVDIKELKGKIVRVVYHEDWFKGFADPIEDKFVPIFGEIFQEVDEKKFREFF